ncbi:MAG: LysR family transcriptional regulator, partial [Firmicutes bacterium]|nr:LysR family transcriptional regulator [Bacillota bacterium]
AAERLYISQPSLSVAIARLEEELGVKLFSRAGRQLTPTEEGRAFLIHAEQVLRETEEAKEHMRRLAARREGRIHLGCIAPVLYGWLPAEMNCFHAQPECAAIRIKFSVENNDELIRKLKNGVYDFVLCSESGDESLAQTRVLSEPVALVLPPGKEAPRTWAELASAPLIGCEEGSFLDRMLRRIGQEHEVSFRFAYRATAEDAIVSLVEHGFGWAVMPWSEALMRKYAVERHELPDGAYARDVYLTTMYGREPAGAAKRFIDFITGRAGACRAPAEG